MSTHGETQSKQSRVRNRETRCDTGSPRVAVPTFKGFNLYRPKQLDPAEMDKTHQSPACAWCAEHNGQFFQSVIFEIKGLPALMAG